MKNILDWIEENKQQFEGPEPRITVADASTEMEQSPDSFLRPKRYDILTGRDVPAETLEEWDTTFRKPNAEGGDQQLVTPSVDGSRPGYQGDITKSKGFREYIQDLRRSGQRVSMPRAKERYTNIALRKNKIVGIKELYKLLGDDVPYTFDTLNNALIPSKQKKIKKSMSVYEKAKLQPAQRLKKIITETLGESQPLGELVGGTSTDKVWNLNKTNINKLKRALKNNYNNYGFREGTIDNIINLSKDTELMKAIDNYVGGKIDETSPIFKKLAKEGAGDLSYAYMQLGRVLRGEIELDGIDKNLKRGNKIVKSLGGTKYEGPLGEAFRRWGKFQMAKHFNDPNATYDTMNATIRKAMKEVGITDKLAIDEVFPARTGQITIGQGSGAYNQVVQLIDEKINSGAKRNFDGQASQRYQDIIEARKNKDWKKVESLVNDHKKAVKNFYIKNPEAKGKVKLTQLNYDPVKKRFASPTEIYGKDVFPSKIQKDMDKFYRKTGLSLDVGSTMTLEKVAKDPKTLNKFLKQAGFNIDKCLSSGGRVKLQGGGGVNTCIRGVIEEEQKKAMKGNKVSFEKFGKFGKLARTGAWILGPLDIPIELAFALPHMLAGDKEAAKRATTFGLFGWGKSKMDEVKAGSPEAYKYVKHMKDNEDYIDAWFENQDLNEDLANLKKDIAGKGTDIQNYWIKEKEDEIKATENKMNFIAENYKGYYDEKGKFDVWGEAKGKSATQDYLIKDVTEKTDKGLDMKQYGGHGMNIALGLPWNFGMKEGIAPFKGGQPITNLKQYIAQKGQPYWKQLEHAAYELGRPELFDRYFTTADVRDPRDAYSDLPIKYASELGKLEKEEMLRGLKKQGEFMTRGFKDMLEAQDIDWDEAYNVGKRRLRASGGRAGYMGGGITGIRKPHAIPPERQGLRSIMINGKKS